MPLLAKSERSFTLRITQKGDPMKEYVTIRKEGSLWYLFNQDGSKVLDHSDWKPRWFNFAFAAANFCLYFGILYTFDEWEGRVRS